MMLSSSSIGRLSMGSRRQAGKRVDVRRQEWILSGLILNDTDTEPVVKGRTPAFSSQS